MTEIKIECAAGEVRVSDEVIAVIAGTAALEIDGVAGMAGNLTGDIGLILGRRNLSKGITVKAEGNSVSISLNLLIKFGRHIQEVATRVQKRVKTAIENMTGLNVTQININVMGVICESKRRPAR